MENPSQGGAALIGIFVFIVLHLDPASGREIEFAAKARLPARPVSVSIEHVANADNLFSVRLGTSSQNGGRAHSVEGQFNAMHPAWDIDRRRYFFVFKLDFARKHVPGPEMENTTSNASYLGIGIPGIDVSETYRDGVGIGHTSPESQAVDGNPWPMGRDEFLTGEINGFPREASLLPRHSRQDNRESGNECSSNGCNRAIVFFQKIND
jgi:hypothetical protein